MRFLITRTTKWDGNPEHPQALKGELLRKLNTRIDGSTYENTFQPYYIDFATLEDLMTFVNEVANVVIENKNYWAETYSELEGVPHLEIYDGYRE